MDSMYTALVICCMVALLLVLTLILYIYPMVTEKTQLDMLVILVMLRQIVKDLQNLNM